MTLSVRVISIEGVSTGGKIRLVAAAFAGVPELFFLSVGACEILDQLRLEITYQYAINHIDPYEGRNNIVHAQESGYLPIRIGGRVRLP